MILILLAHLGAALLGPPLVRAMGRNAFYPLALVPAVSTVWVAAQGGRDLANAPIEQTVPWIPDLGISLAFRMDVLTWVMLLIVLGIGALVLLYCARYFKDTEPGLGRFAGVLTAFAGAMVGLVATDDVMVMYTFWELTTIFSYLLIGHYAEKQASRRAAMNALISTTAGGLAMFVGLLMLGQGAGTLRLSGIIASDMWQHTGPYLVTALVLVLIGATTKSALLPTHFWLPGAMAAPTPVSAYLHAAAMVKAGIYLILRLAPVLAVVGSVSDALVILGCATMILGGWRALRQTDIKLLLAYGTVSQLGFLAAICGAADRGAALAGLALLIAHACFKAPLFMVVGIIDKKFGTRDLRVLDRVGRRAPVVAVIGTISAASMAAVPPLFGFVAKEAVYTAQWKGTWDESILLVVMVLGSVLTVAYSGRFVLGAFGRAHPHESADCSGTPAAEPPAASRIGRTRSGRSRGALVPALFWLPPAVLTVATIVLAPLGGSVEEVLNGYAHTVPDREHAHVHLAVIPHLGMPLAMSALTLGLGALMILAGPRVERFQSAVSPQRWAGGEAGEWVDAERGFRRIMRAVDSLAVLVTSLFQRGSLPYTLGTMLSVLIGLVLTAVLLRSPLPENVVLYHRPAELLILVVVVIAAVWAARSRRRLRAVFLVTATGYSTALLFLLVGGVDVALTQVLVETIMTVVLVLVLRRLPARFSRRPLRRDQWLRWGIAAGTAVVLCGLALYAAAARTESPLGPELIEAAYTIGGGHNVVNVALVDARVWDTMGEISVLLVVATGVASLVFITRREQRISRVEDLDGKRSIWRRRDAQDMPGNVLDFDVRGEDTSPNRWRTWLSAGLTLAPERRMVILEVITRLIFPLMMMFSLYLLMAGHNHPGGGFAGGLVAGLALTLRYLAGGRYELTEAVPVQAGVVLGAGMAIAVLSGAAPLLFGGGIFQSADVHLHLPVLGEIHVVSAMVFDVGVYLVVIGLVLDILRSLGAQLDAQQEADDDVR